MCNITIFLLIDTCDPVSITLKKKKVKENKKFLAHRIYIFHFNFLQQRKKKCTEMIYVFK